MSERHDEPVMPRFGSYDDDDQTASSHATVTDEQPVVPRFSAGVDGSATSASTWEGPPGNTGATGFWSADDKEPIASRSESSAAAADDDSVIVILPEDVVTSDDEDEGLSSSPAGDTPEKSGRGWRAPWSSRGGSDEQDDADEAAIDAELAEADLDTAQVNSAGADVAESDVAESDVAETDVAEADVTEDDLAEGRAAGIDTETPDAETPDITTPDYTTSGMTTSGMTTPGMVPEEVAPAYGSGVAADAGLTGDESIDDAALAGDESIDDAPQFGGAVLADDSDLVGSTAATDLAVDSSPGLGASAGTTGVNGAVADERWREIMVNFVDDPISSVQAAAGLVDDEIAAYTARLAERQQSMRGAWSDSDAADTEALRVALRTYRSFREEFTGLAAKLG